MSLIWSSNYNGITVPDPDAMAYLRNVEVADNQAIEVSVALAVNTFVVGCKADGIWDAIKACCILAGARTTNGALIPLVGDAPTPYNFDLIGDTDYNRATGLAGDGSTKYLDSSFDNQDVPQDDIHQCVYVTTPGSIDAGYIGSPFIGNSHDLTEIYRISTGLYFRNRNAGNPYTASGQQNSTGFMGTSRDNNTEFDYRFNNVTGTKAATFPVNYVNRDINVFRRPLGLSGSTPTDARLSFYSIGESLDLALLDARVSTLMSDLAAAIP